jgi:hypothetical protein
MLVTFVHVFNFGFGLLPHLAFSLSCIYLNSLQGQSCFFPASPLSAVSRSFQHFKMSFYFFLVFGRSNKSRFRELCALWFPVTSSTTGQDRLSSTMNPRLSCYIMRVTQRRITFLVFRMWYFDKIMTTRLRNPCLLSENSDKIDFRIFLKK